MHYYPWSLGQYQSLKISQLPGEYTAVYAPVLRATVATIKHNNHLYPHRYPFVLLGGEKQLWLSVLLKDTSVTAGIRTHILLLTPELESGKLDRSATTLHSIVMRRCNTISQFKPFDWH